MKTKSTTDADSKLYIVSDFRRTQAFLILHHIFKHKQAMISLPKSDSPLTTLVKQFEKVMVSCLRKYCGQDTNPTRKESATAVKVVKEMFRAATTLAAAFIPKKSKRKSSPNDSSASFSGDKYLKQLSQSQNYQQQIQELSPEWSKALKPKINNLNAKLGWSFRLTEAKKKK